jgi:hypothetical protein
MPASYGQGKKAQAIQSILCCAYITIILVISTGINVSFTKGPRKLDQGVAVDNAAGLARIYLKNRWATLTESSTGEGDFPVVVQIPKASSSTFFSIGRYHL